MFWAIPAGFLTGTAAAGGIAFINSVGNLAGFATPFMMGWMKEWTGGVTAGLRGGRHAADLDRDRRAGDAPAGALAQATGGQPLAANGGPPVAAASASSQCGRNRSPTLAASNCAVAADKVQPRWPWPVL